MGLSTHVLDTMNGVPAAGMAVALYTVEGGLATLVRRLTLNHDGRNPDGPLYDDKSLKTGCYRLVFDVAGYFKARGEGAHRHAVVVCHGYPNKGRDAQRSGKSFPQLVDRLSSTLGWDVMMLNFRGCGASEGNFSMLGWIQDVRAAIAHLTDKGAEQVWLVGFGTGGSICITEGAENERVRSETDAGLRRHQLVDQVALGIGQGIHVVHDLRPLIADELVLCKLLGTIHDISILETVRTGCRHSHRGAVSGQRHRPQ